MTAAALSPATSMRARLKQSTLELHRSVERHFNLDDRTWTATDYCRLLEGLWGIYVPLERALLRIDWRQCGFDAAARCKSAWLKADLAHFGLSHMSIIELPCCDDLPKLDTVADGLGAFYVLEGATLGGRVILGALEPQLGISPDAGGRFFASYGAAVGPQWRSYLDALEHCGATPSSADSITQSAILTFESFERWFSARELNAALSPEKCHAHA
jgi:heme oxygenase